MDLRGSALKYRVTVASFQSRGTAPVDMNEEYINDSGSARLRPSFLMNIGGKPTGPGEELLPILFIAKYSVRRKVD